MSVYKDEFFESILEKLNGKLDADLFEKCVVDILRRNDYPTLVPISGGQDSGMDGALSDGNGTPIPLVTTTNKSPITNLEKNLSKYKEDGGERSQVIFATSVSLTPRRSKNLYDKARKLGFELIQVYEQEALAMRLYHEPSWCKNLLGLTGRPRALSKIPINSRSVISNITVGRDLEKQLILKKISEKKDAAILGQPGIGKTFLLSDIVKNTNAFFLNNDDTERIYGDIRELNPDTIILDDAQVKIETLKSLIHFRRENSIEFNLLCVTWPSYKQEILTELEITENDCVELRLLGREDIVKVINSCGILGPRVLIYHLVNQSSGKPGLSAMLSKICLSGGINDFISGMALRRVLLSSITKHFGYEVEHVLAYFSFLGDKGASFNEVSKWSDIEKYKLHKVVSDLALLGILKEVRDDKLAVIPEDLRFVLVRDNFFKGALSLDKSEFLAMARDEVAIVEVLVGVLAKGGQVDGKALYDLIKTHGERDVLEMYAGLGRDEVLKLIADFPDNIQDFLHSALAFAPKEAVPLLLKQSVNNPKENLHSLPGHPARKLQDWVSGVRSGKMEAIRNKKILLDAIILELKDDGNDKMLYEIIPSIFSPSWSSSESDPGSGMTITLTDGYYSVSEIKSISSLWILFFNKISELKNLEWGALLTVLNNFAYPHTPRIALPEKVRKECHTLAKKMIDDLYSVGKLHLGVCLKLKDYSQKLRYKKLIKIDDDFTILFPKESLRADHKRVEKKYLKDTEALVDKHFKKDPAKVLKRLVEVYHFAKEVGKNWPDLTHYYVDLLARKVKKPVKWFYVGVDLQIPPQYLEPFAEKALDELDDKMEAEIIRLLDTDYYWVFCSLTLLRECPSTKLLSESLKRLDKSYSEVIEHLFYRNVPLENTRKLLCHDCREVREASAIGEFLAGEERKKVRDELREVWEEAIIEAKDEEYWLKEILPQNPDLAFRWVKKRVNDDEYLSYHERETFNSAMDVIGKEHSIELLGLLKENFSSREKVKRLVGNDVDCFNSLLNNANLKYLHLIPLEKKRGKVLIDFLELALKQNYSSEELARAVYSISGSWSGRESNMISGKIQAYKETLKSVSDSDIRNVITLVISFFESSKERALKREHEEDVYGRF